MCFCYSFFCLLIIIICVLKVVPLPWQNKKNFLWMIYRSIFVPPRPTTNKPADFVFIKKLKIDYSALEHVCYLLHLGGYENSRYEISRNFILKKYFVFHKIVLLFREILQTNKMSKCCERIAQNFVKHCHFGGSRFKSNRKTQKTCYRYFSLWTRSGSIFKSNRTTTKKITMKTLSPKESL
jgi:hypothetical protein